MSQPAEKMAPSENLMAVLTVTDEIRRNLRQGEAAMTIATAYIIDSSDMAQAASDERANLAKRIDQLEVLRKGFLKPAEEIITNAKALFNPAIQALTEARMLLGTRIQAWTDSERKRIAAENAKREEESRRARQEADAKAAAERARAEQEAAEQRRIAQEAEQRRLKAIEEGNTRAAKAAAAEAAKAAEKADAAIETGNAKAMEAQSRAAAVGSSAPIVTATKITGSSERDNWVPELLPDTTEEKAKELIVAACANRTDLLAYLKLDMPAINKASKAFKGKAVIPGFTVVNRPVLAGARK